NYNRVNHNTINNPNWEHRPEHRKGVEYRDQGSRDKFGQGQRPGADTREAYRGRAEAGPRDIAGGRAGNFGGGAAAPGGGLGRGGGGGGMGGFQQPGGQEPWRRRILGRRRVFRRGARRLRRRRWPWRRTQMRTVLALCLVAANVAYAAGAKTFTSPEDA